MGESWELFYQHCIELFGAWKSNLAHLLKFLAPLAVLILGYRWLIRRLDSKAETDASDKVLVWHERDGPGHFEMKPTTNAGGSSKTVGIRSLLPLLLIVLVLTLIAWFTH